MSERREYMLREICKLEIAQKAEALGGRYENFAWKCKCWGCKMALINSKTHQSTKHNQVHGGVEQKLCEHSYENEARAFI